MADRHYDWIIIGGGGAGTSITYFLAQASQRTLTLERFQQNHPFGSSHGESRILRTAYSEKALYVPLVLRARRLWTQLGDEIGQEIFRRTGVLILGSAVSRMVRGALRSARTHGRPYGVLDANELVQRYPSFHLDPDDVAVWDPGGGVIFPERAISAYVTLARSAGARFRWNEPAKNWKSSRGEVVVRTSRGEYRAGGLIIAAGAWLPSLVPELGLPLTIERQTVYWYRPRLPVARQFSTMPAFVWQRAQRGYYYGIPDLGAGVKIASDQGSPVVHPSRVSRRPIPRDLRRVQRFVRHHFPDLPRQPRRWVSCLYTNTPDRDFLIDYHPDSTAVILVSACSGHGFKFLSAIGELVARTAIRGRSQGILRPFTLRRLARGG